MGKKYIVSPENLVDMIYNWARYNGESIENAGERAGKFLNMINDPQRRIYFAEKVHHYDIAINVRILFVDFIFIRNNPFVFDFSRLLLQYFVIEIN